MQISLTRRQLTALLGAVIGGAAVASYWAHYGRTTTPISIWLPEVGDPENPSLEVFAALCRIVLVRDDLRREPTKRLFELFKAEPWGPKHIGTAFAHLRGQILAADQQTTGLRFASLPDGEKWFVEHLLKTWYLGIYYHEQRPTQRVLYEDALMFESLRGAVPIPFVEATGFAGWTEAPGDAAPK